MSHLSITSRIVWCRRFRRQAPTHSEKDGWRAEEQGLRDALLMRDHSNDYRSRLPDVFARYLTGFQDAQTLIRMAKINPALAQLRYRTGVSPSRLFEERARREAHTNILLIKDERSLLTPLHGVLKSKNDQVLEVQTRSGLKRHQAGPADLIITDLAMPKMPDRPSLELTKDC